MNFSETSSADVRDMHRLFFRPNGVKRCVLTRHGKGVWDGVRKRLPRHEGASEFM
jgi:hypothetical protein